MTKEERVEAYVFRLVNGVRMCENCRHYYPHYDEAGRALGCGHCVHPRCKLRRAYDVCDKFEQK